MAKTFVVTAATRIADGALTRGWVVELSSDRKHSTASVLYPTEQKAQAEAARLSALYLQKLQET